MIYYESLNYIIINGHIKRKDQQIWKQVNKNYTIWEEGVQGKMENMNSIYRYKINATGVSKVKKESERARKYL